MDPTIKRRSVVPSFNRNALILVGTALIVVGFVVLGISAWEGFGDASRTQLVRMPGFHELKLDREGLYLGLYQHRGTGPIPVQALSNLDVRVMSKDDYQEVPVLMNTAGVQFNRLGFQGMPLFNFVAPRAGTYTMSAVYLKDVGGPNVPIMIFHQGVQNIRQTLVVGVLFCLFSVALGIWVLVKRNAWSAGPPPAP